MKNEGQLLKLAASLEVGRHPFIRFGTPALLTAHVSTGGWYRRKALDRTTREHTDRIGDETGSQVEARTVFQEGAALQMARRQEQLNQRRRRARVRTSMSGAHSKSRLNDTTRSALRSLKQACTSGWCTAAPRLIRPRMLGLMCNANQGECSLRHGILGLAGEPRVASGGESATAHFAAGTERPCCEAPYRRPSKAIPVPDSLRSHGRRIPFLGVVCPPTHKLRAPRRPASRFPDPSNIGLRVGGPPGAPMAGPKFRQVLRAPTRGRTEHPAGSTPPATARPGSGRRSSGVHAERRQATGAASGTCH